MLFFRKNKKTQEEVKNIAIETAPEVPVKTPEELEAEKAAAKAAAKEKAIAAYREKRDLTVAKFFEITEMELPHHLQHLADRSVENITADVRRVTENDIYFYWNMSVIDRDTATDVETPLDRAIEKKPMLIITDEPCDYPDTLQIVSDRPEHDAVRDIYLKALHYIRSIHRAKVIAVTGSIGKTSTKEMIESVIRQHYRNPLVSKGNNNSFFSISRNIQELKRPTNVYLQEVGAYSPRTIEMSARQLDCNMVVYTNISTPHRDQYGSVENTLKDKASLSDYGKEDGIAFVNYDDPMLMAYPFRQKKVTYSLRNPEAMYFAKDIEVSDDGYTFKIVTRGEDGTLTETEAEVHVLGEHNVLNAVVAWAVGQALKLDEEEILDGIDAYRPSGMRQNLIEANGYRVYADCYNSNQVAIENTLTAMDHMTLPEGGRRIAVLGDVLSLGDISEEIHRQIGRTIKDHKVDKLICYANHMRYACEEAQKDGVDAVFFSDRQRPEMEEEIRRILRPEDVILFKASHVVNLGSTMDRLFGTDANESVSIGHRQFRLVEEGGFEYYAFADGASVKTCLSEEESVVIPTHITAEVRDEYLDFQDLPGTEVRTLKVEKIGKTAFRNKAHVRHVELPSTLVRIRDGAFRGCGIEEIRIPEGTISIGREAFAHCENLKQVIIPDSVKDFGSALLKDSPQAVIVCREGSAADTYAKEHEYTVEYI